MFPHTIVNELRFCYNKYRTLLLLPSYIDIHFPLVIQYYVNGKVYYHTIDGPEFNTECHKHGGQRRSDDISGDKPQENQEQLLR